MPANVSPPHWNAARKSMAASRKRRSKEPKPPTRPCTIILIKPSASPSGSARSSAILSPAGVPAMAIDPVMEPATGHLAQMATTSKHFARRLVTIGENRLELLIVEMQEERERLL